MKTANLLIVFLLLAVFATLFVRGDGPMPASTSSSTAPTLSTPDGLHVTDDWEPGGESFVRSQIDWLDHALVLQSDALAAARSALQEEAAKQEPDPARILELTREVVGKEMARDAIIKRIEETKQTGQ